MLQLETLGERVSGLAGVSAMFWLLGGLTAFGTVGLIAGLAPAFRRTAFPVTRTSHRASAGC